ncbi:uncharacterized protein LOC112682255 isoform X2 [Sipha flava]|uniref:Uncharacterized protein LOC112682255 isoform X2 n=1 Tax=Sipha flava TaxID=143950 RepID=A0A8B8FDB4_9HEMI|nr:uncharacterized protein LOC112682255 isoform X2 [Sipha flava]
MEPVGRTNNSSSTTATAASVTSAVVGLLLTPARTSVDVNIPKTTALVHSDNHVVPLQHCSTSTNVVHHQYSPIILPPPPSTVLIRSTQTNSLLPASPQLMLSTIATTTSGVVSHFQPHGNGSHQLVTASTVPVSAALPVMPTSNITSAGMALSPFGILPHERVVPHHTLHYRHQPKKLMSSSSSKTLMDPSNSNNPQILTTPVIHSQRFYIEPPSHVSNKMKQYDNIQQQHIRTKNVHSISDKSVPVVSSPYNVQSYEQRYQPRTSPQQVGYLSVITRTAVTTTNSVVLNDVIASNSNYYPPQPIPLQSKTSDNQDRQYYHFDSTVSASHTPQQQLDNILLMGTPVQRGDPMHIVKNLQSMQTDIDGYGVKKMIEQPPRLLTTDNCKTIGFTGILSNGSKTITDHQHQHLQSLPKSSVIDPSATYNGQYFIRRQPPPAHLHQHQNQPHLQQHIVTGNISSGVFHQPSLQHQQFNNVPSTFNVPPSTSIIHQNQQQLSQPVQHNNFNALSINPTYYNPASTIVSTFVTSVATTNSSISSYSRPHQVNQPQHSNNFQEITNNVHDGNYIASNDTRSSSLPHVIVPNIEQELSHLCDIPTTTYNNVVKPFNTTVQKPSFLDSYVKFLRGGASCTTVEKEEICFDLPKKLIYPLSCSTPKPMPKPYIPLKKPKIVSVSENLTPSRNGSSEDNKKISNVTTTTDDDPRYFPLPKTSSSIAGISDDKSDGSNDGNSWMSGDDDQEQWWITSSKRPFNSATSVAKNKLGKASKKKKNSGKKVSTNSAKANKKQKTQHTQQPKRQLSRRLAKEKTQKLISNIDGVLDEDDDLLSEPDSDIDPAWKPNSDDNDVSKDDFNSNLNRRNFSHKKFSKSDHTPSTSSSINNNNNDQSDDSNAPLFKSGTFVALKSQYLNSDQSIPQQLWRVDGKSLLQKYKRCNGDNVYKSVSTYTGWNPSHYSMYRQVTVQFVPTYKGVKIVQNKSSTQVLVQLVSDDDNKTIKNNSVVNTEVDSSNCNSISKSKTKAFHSVSSNTIDSAKDQNVMLRAQFDVYIQSLASQALDQNFLVEIYRENDEYFLSNVRAIDKVTQTWVEAIDSAIIRDLVTDLTKVENIRTLIKRYPTMEMYTTDESSVHNIQLRCIVCGYQGFVDKQRKFVEISLSGTEYNNRTLKNSENNRPFSKIMPAKRVNCCSSTQCSEKVIILHSLEHLKYQLYQECCKRVTIENNNRNKLTQDTTTVLNRLLADDTWIENLYQTVCNTWDRAKRLVSNDQ